MQEVLPPFVRIVTTVVERALTSSGSALKQDPLEVCPCACGCRMRSSPPACQIAGHSLANSVGQAVSRTVTQPTSKQSTSP